MPASGLHLGWRQIVDVCLLSLTSVQISCVPRRTSLEAILEHSLKGRLDSVLLGWTRHGRLEQVRPYKVWHDPGNIKGYIQTNIAPPFFSLWNILANKTNHVSICLDFCSVSSGHTTVCSSQGQSSQLVESIRGDEWDQTGAEAALLLHTQPDVPSHTVTQLAEGTTQQPTGRLPQLYLFLLNY